MWKIELLQSEAFTQDSQGRPASIPFIAKVTKETQEETQEGREGGREPMTLNHTDRRRGDSFSKSRQNPSF